MNPWRDRLRILQRLDWALVFTLLALLAAGICFVYSASYRGEDLPASPFFRKQIIWALAGLAAFLGLALFDYHQFRDSAWWFYAVALVLLVLVFVIGIKVYGAYRWLNVFGIRMQPSEVGKLAAMILLARFLSRPGRDLGAVGTTVVALLMVGVPFILILKEPDLGSASVLLPMAFCMLFAAGVPLRILGALILIGLLLAPLGWLTLGDYQRERILVFLNPDRDPLDAGWNRLQSAIAVGSGGFAGKGFLNGTQNVLGFLPRTVAPTDFIFSVIAEEMGFVGAAVLLLMYTALLVGCVRAALLAPDKLGRLLAVGVTSLLFCHMFVNVGMTIGLLPITGLPLPLISYGGSFMLSTMAGLGIVQSVYVRRMRR